MIKTALLSQKTRKKCLHGVSGVSQGDSIPADVIARGHCHFSMFMWPALLRREGHEGIFTIIAI